MADLLHSLVFLKFCVDRPFLTSEYDSRSINVTSDEELWESALPLGMGRYISIEDEGLDICVEFRVTKLHLVNSEYIVTTLQVVDFYS